MKTITKLSFLVLSLALLLASCASETATAPDTTQPVASTDTTAAMEDMDDMDDLEEGHEHGEDGREWDGPTEPEISLRVSGDEATGWTITTEVVGFTLTDADTTEAVPAEGHLHLFVDGQLATMVYEAEHLLNDLEPGDHQIMVTLSTNDHLDYLLDGEPIMAMDTITVAGEISDADVVLDVAFSGGSVTSPTDPEIPLGSLVEIIVVTDVVESLHLHGYDVEVAVTPDAPTMVRFIADIPGIFEVELEESGVFVMSIRVQ